MIRLSASNYCQQNLRNINGGRGYFVSDTNIGITLEYKRKKLKKKKSYFPKTAKRSEIQLRSKIQVNRIHFL